MCCLLIKGNMRTAACFPWYEKGIKEEISLTSCPRPFRGPAIEMVTAGLMALALVGFYGLHLS